MGIMSQKEITDEMEALNLGTSNGGLPKVNTPVDRGDTDALDTAIIEMRRKEVETADTAIPTTYYDKDDQDFTEYRTPVEAPEESLEVAPSIAITQMEKALTKPSTESSDVSSNTDVSSTATYGNLWGRAYHTEAENDSVKQADYAADVAAYVKPNSSYVQSMSPILDTVVAAFAGDEGTDPAKLHRAMLEIGAHESEGGTQLYNKKSGASGVFQVLASTVLATSTSPYYGPKAQALAGKTPAQIAAMTKAQRETWMQTDLTANAVFGTIELIKLSKGLSNAGEPKYLKTIQTKVDKTDWSNILPQHFMPDNKKPLNWGFFVSTQCVITGGGVQPCSIKASMTASSSSSTILVCIASSIDFMVIPDTNSSEP